MFRNISLLLAAAACLAAQTAPKAPSQPSAAKTAPDKTQGDKPQIDKAKIEAYIRHLFVWPPPIEIAVGDPQPGPVPGFFEVKIRASHGNSGQDETFYISKDGKKIVRGDFFDMAQNPFKENLDKIKTEFQPSIGTPGAPVVVVEFSDFECPFCREEATVLRENLIQTYPKEVRMYYMNFPLESLHPWAKDAAMAGRCIFHQNVAAFWDYHDWIFEHQDEITPDNLKSKILDAMQGKDGVDRAQLSSCIDSKSTEQEVQATRDLGHSLDVNSTPTLFINGRRMSGAIRWDDLKRVIDYEIDYQKTAKNAGEDCGCSVALPMPGMANGTSNGTLK
jgi:protein-disulfide isomerase